MKINIVLINVLLLLYPLCSNSQIITNDSIQKYPNRNDSLNAPISFNRNWNSSEFLAEIDSLNSKFDTKDFYPPIIKNNDSNILKKLTTYQEYWFLESSFINSKEKVNMIIPIYKSLNFLTLNYYKKGEAKNGKLIYEKEIANLSDILFKLTISLINQSDILFSNNSSLSQIQLDGLKKMQHGANTMMAGFLTIFEKDYTQFSSSSICEMCQSFKELYDFMYSREDAQTKLEFNKRIQLLKKNSSITCIRDILSSSH